MSNLILIGFKSAGKATLGKVLARKLQKSFIDTDSLFTLPPREMYQRLGEEAFRKHEKNLLLTLASISGAVIATGGGTPCHPESAQFLRNLGLVIHLHTPKALIEERLARSSLPPCLQNESFDAFYARRLDRYAQIADRTLTTEDELWALMGPVPQRQ